MLVGSGILILKFLLLFHLFTLQIENNEAYDTMAEENRLRFVPTTPVRGLIYDRNGNSLARNHTIYRLELVPNLVKDIDKTLTGLSEVVNLSQDELALFKKKLTAHESFHSLILKNRLTEEEIARFAVDRYRFPGVDIIGSLGRHYPYDEVFAHVVGYLGKVNKKEMDNFNSHERYSIHHTGKSGIELQYEKQLRGKSGMKTVEVNAEGRFLRVTGVKEALSGKDIHLTLDKDLQSVAYEALGDAEGAVVAIDPRNGDVLAMVSKPVFNPNQFMHGFSKHEYKNLLADSSSLFFHRAISGQYPPGSTIKPIIALAALEHRITSPNHYINAGPYYVVPGYTRKFRDWLEDGHGKVNLRSSIAQSCDVFFYDLSYRLGIDKISTFMSEFGLGALTNIELNNEASGLVPSREWKLKHLQQKWYPEETVITGIGQGYLLLTPLQLAVMTATIANHGKRVQPRLLKTHPSRHDIQEEIKTEFVSEIEIAQQYWDFVIKGMIDVVHRSNGTAYAISSNISYMMAGKTGTAQVYGINRDEEDEKDEEKDSQEIDKSLRDHALFIAFAPVDDPTIAIAIIVEHAGSGSRYAAPIARSVFDTYFEVNNTRKHATTIPKLDRQT